MSYYNLLENRIARLESLIYNEAKDDTNVIVKVDNVWKILKKDKKSYWNAEYNTKKDAQDALKAYWANKHEYKNKHHSIILEEGFTSGICQDLIKNIQSFLIKIFGHSLYFDHYTDKSVDLYYKGKEVAELLYDDKNEEIVIYPEDNEIAPVSFYDTSEYEIKDFLSDLLLGDLNPSYT